MSDEIDLPSGKPLYANLGIIGISADLCVSQGCDGDLEGADLRSIASNAEFEPGEYRHLSIADKVVIADTMIERWKSYRLKVIEEGE